MKIKIIKNVNSKETINSQLLKIEPKRTKTKANKVNNQNRNRTTEMKWRSRGGLSVGGKNGGKGTGNKKHKWQVQNRQGEVKNSMRNGEGKELICTTQGCELRWGNDGMRGMQGGGK